MQRDLRLGRTCLGMFALAWVLLAPDPAVAATRESVSKLSAIGYLLEIDGNPVGRPLSVTGGFAVGQVVVNGSNKQIAGAVPTPLEITFSGGMASAWYQWLAQQLASPAPAPTTIGVVRTDGAGRLRDRLTIPDAKVVRLDLPALDTNVASPAAFRVLIAGGTGQLQAASGKAPQASTSTLLQTPMANRYKLQLDGLGAPPVARFDSVSVERGPPQASPGARFAPTAPPPAHVNTISLLLADSAAGPFFQWYVDMVLQGQQDLERQGTLSYLTQHAAASLGSVTLQGLGITRFEWVMIGGKPFVKVELYCEGIALDLGGMAM